ncbi:MAG: hypothetical protein IT529_17810 [Burkholderiales bacterium]|nr:hypothetical protein [Burkholderiales bacterium]
MSRRRTSQALRQRGQAMLLTVLLLAVGGAAAIYTLATPAALSVDADRRTAAALALARDALIGYAARDANRPGSLPCPDTDDDGSTEIFAGMECASYTGRLPWRTLGLPDLRDGYGERLWYSVSREFARNPACGAACPLNSDTAGELTVQGLAPVANAIAVVLAPGVAVSPQERSALASGPCPTTGATVVNSLCAANYLEDENANGVPPADGLFVTAGSSAVFNDQLLAITSDALFHVVNTRVAKEVRKALTDYRNAYGHYPRANRYDDATFNCEDGIDSGRLPLNVETCSHLPPLYTAPVAFNSWGGLLPAWYGANRWNTVTHYAVSRTCAAITDDALLAPIVNPLLVSFCDIFGYDLGLLAIVFPGAPSSPALTVTAGSTARFAGVVLLVTGRALPAYAQVHPCASANQCLEAPNTGASPFTKPAWFPQSNDRLATVCAAITPCDAVP